MCSLVSSPLGSSSPGRTNTCPAAAQIPHRSHHLLLPVTSKIDFPQPPRLFCPQFPGAQGVVRKGAAGRCEATEDGFPAAAIVGACYLFLAAVSAVMVVVPSRRRCCNSSPPLVLRSPHQPGLDPRSSLRYTPNYHRRRGRTRPPLRLLDLERSIRWRRAGIRRLLARATVSRGGSIFF